MKILLIEDNEHLREINKLKLQSDCHAMVDATSSISEAIELLVKIFNARGEWN